MKEKTKLRKILSILLKAFIIITAYGFIYTQLFEKKELLQVLKQLKSETDFSFAILIFCVLILMMFLNWSIEAIKWRYLIKKLEKISILKALIAVFTGATVSAFTPNRIGDFFARIFVLEKAERVDGILVTIIGSFSQLLITLVMGLLSMLIFPEYIGLNKNIPQLYYYGFLTLSVITIALMIGLFLNISMIYPIIGRFNFSLKKKILKHTQIFSLYSSKELITVLLFSFLRYLVFTLQFYILLRFFSINIPLIEGMAIIMIIFFITTAIPTIALSELGVRGMIALLIITIFYEKNMLTAGIETNIIASTSILWLINLVLPALLGTFFIFKLKFFRKR